MSSTVRYVGLDVHKETVVIAVADDNARAAEVLGEVPHEASRILARLRKLGPVETLRVCYEAGPTGYGLQRHLLRAGISCVVVAPSLVPSQSGQRVKTDRRDARRLAHFLRSGDLTPVWVPDEQTEALRDLERAREDAKRAEKTAKQQLSKFLLRQGRPYTEGKQWTKPHWRWIEQQTFTQEAHRRVLVDAIQVVHQATDRVERLEQDIAELIEGSVLGPLVRDLQAFRGVALVTAVGLAAEIGDFHRFATAGQFMAFVGLVPSEYSSGGHRSQGGITKTGNRHVRRLLIEAGWNYYRWPLRLSVALRARRQEVPQAVIDIADKAMHRLGRKGYRMRERGMSPKKIVTALARELAGFLWAAARVSTPRLLADPNAATTVVQETAGPGRPKRAVRTAATGVVDSVPPGPRGRPRGPVVATGAGLPRRDSANATRCR
jgi:transposase